MSVLHDSYHTLLDGAEWPSCLEVVSGVLGFFPFLKGGTDDILWSKRHEASKLVCKGPLFWVNSSVQLA